MSNVIDLGKLAQPGSNDEHLAGIVMLAQANADAYRCVIDNEHVEEAFVMGHTRSLAAFVQLTTGGVVNIPEDALLRAAYLAYVDMRGMLWVAALASTLTPPEDGGLEFDTDLVVAYLAARKASEVAEEVLTNIVQRIAVIMQRHEENQRATAALMMDPRAMRGSSS